MIKVIFSTTGGIGSRLLRVMMASPYSHCGIVAGDDVIEASTHGVRVVSLYDFIRGSTKHEVCEYEGDNDAAVAAALKQVGKPYDWLGVAGVAAQRNWQDDDCWFCSELAAYALRAGGMCPVRLDADRITPRDLWVCGK